MDQKSPKMHLNFHEKLLQKQIINELKINKK